MRLFETLFKGTTQSDFSSRLHKKMSQLLPKESEETHFKLACISGLFARVAYADLQIEDIEKERIEQALKSWTELQEAEVKAVTNLACEEVVDLAGIENTRYCHPLGDRLSNAEKFALVKSLFAIAAADGSVEHVESEEIRTINQGLLLEHKHYISARATVMDKLKALQN